MVVAVPAVTPVKVAVYVPLLLSVTAEKVPVETPPLRVNATLAPPVLRALPAASLAVRVTVVVDPELTVAEATVTTDAEAEMVPEVTVTVGKGELVTARPVTVAAIEVAVPAVTPVKVAV